MILFSLISLRYISELPSTFNTKPISYVIQHKNVLKKSKKHQPILAYSIKKIDFSFESKDNSSKSLFIDQNFWQNLLNTLWCRSFFLSTSNKMMNNYTTKLKSLSLNNNYKSQYKYLLSEFSSSLMNNNVKSSLSNFSSDLNVQAIECIKLNHFHFMKINDLIKLIKQNVVQQDHVKKQIDLNSIPLYIVSNHLGQMIIAEQPDNLKWQNVSSSFKSGNLSEGWFFVNVEDAQEYLNYILRNYGLNMTSKKLKIFTCNLQTFYRLVSNYNNKILFRLVPDLNEIGNLINKYRYYSNVSFHKDQKYGKNYFKGQPIYLINSNYQNGYNEIYVKGKRSTLIFMNYKTALDVCNKIDIYNKKKILRRQFQKLPVVKLTVYNLENFLHNQADSYSMNIDRSNFILVPSKHSYNYTKINYLDKKNQTILNEVIINFSYVKLWCKRILWSLTSKKPIG